MYLSYLLFIYFGICINMVDCQKHETTIILTAYFDVITFRLGDHSTNGTNRTSLSLNADHNNYLEL